MALTSVKNRLGQGRPRPTRVASERPKHHAGSGLILEELAQRSVMLTFCQGEIARIICRSTLQARGNRNDCLADGTPCRGRPKRSNCSRRTAPGEVLLETTYSNPCPRSSGVANDYCLLELASMVRLCLRHRDDAVGGPWNYLVVFTQVTRERQRADVLGLDDPRGALFSFFLL